MYNYRRFIVDILANKSIESAQFLTGTSFECERSKLPALSPNTYKTRSPPSVLAFCIAHQTTLGSQRAQSHTAP